jgi:hypothetical protein
MRVETLDYGPDALIAKRGIREQMASILMNLDVWLDPSPTLDEDFWGLLRSEFGRRGLSCDDLPGGSGASTDRVGSVVILDGSNLVTVLDGVRASFEHWMMRGHSKERIVEIGFYVSRPGGMERAEVRGPISSVLQALDIGMDGFSEVGRGSRL